MSLLLMAFDIMIMEIVHFVEEKKLSKLTCLLKYKILGYIVLQGFSIC